MSGASTAAILDHVRQAGILRPRELAAAGIPGAYLSRLAAAGDLTRIGRGLYVLPDAPLSAQHTLAAVSARIPIGVICLESALQFHGMTTATPRRVWLAIQPKAWKPRGTDLPVRIARFSGNAFTAGVEVHRVDGLEVPIYSPAKTVADCFKYRNKIGLDLAIEALRDFWDQRRGTAEELSYFARIDRVENVMRPYMESLR